METKTILTLIGFVVVLFGYIAVHRLNEWRNKRADIRSAVQKYKSTFRNQISNAKGIGKFYMGDMASGFSAHESAVQDIFPILPKRYQRKLQETWNEYTGKGNGLGYDPEEYIRTMWACVELGQPETSDNIENKFHRLFTCLDDFIK